MKLPELEQSLLRAARESFAPSADDRERHEAALLTRLSGATPSSPRLRGLGRADTRGALGMSGMLPKVAPGAAVGSLELVSIGLAIGVVLGGVVGFALGRSGGDSLGLFGRAATEELERAGTPDGHGDNELPSAALASSESLKPDAVDSAGALASEGAGLAEHAELRTDARAVGDGQSSLDGARAHQRTRGKTTDTRKKAAPESSLAIELSMLQRARRALNANNGLLALGIVQELDERFPRGVLIEERTATRVLSLCLLGRTDEARLSGREFLMQHPSSVYAERVRASCAR